MLSTNNSLPDVNVATMQDGEIVSHSLKALFADGLHILVGVPGVYTPICSNEHLPNLIHNADELKALGVKSIACISDDNPWAIEAWKETLDGHEKVLFLCDGNRDFLRECNLSSGEAELFLAGKYARFYLILHDGVIKRTRFEATVLNTVCTTGESMMQDVRSYMDMMKAG